jgi:hypothetical protein
LIQRQKGEPNLRLLCGFTDVPGKASFSQALGFLSEQGIRERTLGGIVFMAHTGRDSTTIAAREKVVKEAGRKGAETGKKAGPSGQKQPESPQRTNGHRKTGSAGRSHIHGKESTVLLQSYGQRV